MERETVKKVKSVCIIGAGPSGLATIKNILESKSDTGLLEYELEGTVFEQASEIGGVWNYDEELAQTLFHNPMYIGLRTNFPKEVMHFMDFPSDHYETEDTYVARKHVFNYLKKYAEVNGLMGRIQLNRKVTSVNRIFRDGCSELKWRVEVQNTEKLSEKSNLEFDSVIICSGSQGKARYPSNAETIKNSFKGKILHSVDYNRAEVFKDQTVLLIGGGPSGRDLGMEISRVGKQVYLSLHDFDKQAIVIPKECFNIEQIRGIKTAKEHSVVTEDDQEFNCDVIIFCTGYEYDYPFLESGILQISEGGKYVEPLYLHLIHRKYPSLCVFGLADLHLPFFLPDCQSKFYVHYLQGKLKLPTESQMNQAKDQEDVYRQKYGLVGPKSHIFYSLQWPYIRRLGIAADFIHKVEEYLPVFEKIYFTLFAGAIITPFEFRNRNFEKILKDSEGEEDPTKLCLDLSAFPSQQ